MFLGRTLQYFLVYIDNNSATQLCATGGLVTIVIVIILLVWHPGMIRIGERCSIIVLCSFQLHKKTDSTGTLHPVSLFSALLLKNNNTCTKATGFTDNLVAVQTTQLCRVFPQKFWAVLMIYEKLLEELLVVSKIQREMSIIMWIYEQ